ncbi:hypothetical protein FIBSPDRAFT_964253 [Athelia psychrophila]|uniref:Uncharacterized protein n=1 Tax=Athelia psychrophila TaxID=1759441 RepID=A0A165Y048_9AGAM|nr:hypothetical protein FIBSPDRAFT_964253 [Fibularhizoctonia sp. CBS 109695]
MNTPTLPPGTLPTCARHTNVSPIHAPVHTHPLRAATCGSVTLPCTPTFVGVGTGHRSRPRTITLTHMCTHAQGSRAHTAALMCTLTGPALHQPPTCTSTSTHELVHQPHAPARPPPCRSLPAHAPVRQPYQHARHMCPSAGPTRMLTSFTCTLARPNDMSVHTPVHPPSHTHSPHPCPQASVLARQAASARPLHARVRQPHPHALPLHGPIRQPHTPVHRLSHTCQPIALVHQAPARARPPHVPRSLTRLPHP